MRTEAGPDIDTARNNWETYTKTYRPAWVSSADLKPFRDTRVIARVESDTDFEYCAAHYDSKDRAWIIENGKLPNGVVVRWINACPIKI
jgi:hypothetical protein